MTCREMTEFLAEYVAGELPPDILATFEGHVAHCPDCVVFLSQYRTAIRAGITAFDDLPGMALPEELVAAILASIKQD
jgi:anti-sigma factor RsiW